MAKDGCWAHGGGGAARGTFVPLAGHLPASLLATCYPRACLFFPCRTNGLDGSVFSYSAVA